MYNTTDLDPQIASKHPVVTCTRESVSCNFVKIVRHYAEHLCTSPGARVAQCSMSPHFECSSAVNFLFTNHLMIWIISTPNIPHRNCHLCPGEPQKCSMNWQSNISHNWDSLKWVIEGSTRWVSSQATGAGRNKQHIQWGTKDESMLAGISWIWRRCMLAWVRTWSSNKLILSGWSKVWEERVSPTLWTFFVRKGSTWLGYFLPLIYTADFNNLYIHKQRSTRFHAKA